MEKFKKILKWTLLSFGIILTAVMCSGALATSFVKNNFNNEKQAQQFSNTCPHLIENAETKLMGKDLWILVPMNKNEVIYCIEPGGASNAPCDEGDGIHHKAQIERWAREEKESSPCLYYQGYPQDCPHKDHTSTTFWECTNNHKKESDEYDSPVYGHVNNLYDVGYILSLKLDPLRDKNEPDWYAAIQQAVWMSPISQRSDPHREAFRTQGENIREESIAYKDFYEKIAKTYSEYYGNIPQVPQGKTGKTGMKPVDLTDHKELKRDVDQEHKTNKIGPFKLDYVDGECWVNYSDGKNKRKAPIGYGGISDMYFTDNNGKRYEIKALIRSNYNDDAKINSANDRVYANYNEPRYFTNKEYKEPYGWIENPNLTDYIAFMNYYPKPNEEFYVEIEANDDVKNLTLHVDFKWLVCKSEMCLREGYRLRLEQQEEFYKPHTDYDCDDTGCTKIHDYGLKKYLRAVKEDMQDSAYRISSERTYETDSIEIPVDIGAGDAMKLGGYVFEDSLISKQNTANGIKDSSDIGLRNVEVTLYEIDKNGHEKLAKLAKPEDEMIKKVGESDADFATRKKKVEDDPNDYKRRINPTLTDENGYYEFRGLNVNKKYYVKFTYNGQEYMPTDYLSINGNKLTNGNVSSIVNDEKMQKGQNVIYDVDGLKNVNTIAQENWKNTSKGTERILDRENFDKRFEEIRSYPNNYPTSNSLGKTRTIYNGKYYNKIFSTYDLAGIELQDSGKYKQGDSLVDTYLKVEDGNVKDTRNSNKPEFKEGKISREIQSFIKDNRRYPDVKTEIYPKIAGNDEEMWQKLQFIEDCKISSYTKNQNANMVGDFDKYPVFDKFTTSVKTGNEYPYNSFANRSFASNATTYENHMLKHNGNGKYGIIEYDKPFKAGIWEAYPHTELHNDIGKIVYPNIYKGQLEINQGLWKRQKSTLSINKDVAYAATKINNKTEVYEYNKNRDLDLTTGEQGVRDEIYDKIRNGTWTKDDLAKLERMEMLHNWSIQARIKARDLYYDEVYNRKLYPADYNYIASSYNYKDNREENNRNLEVYLTYKITVHNGSQGIINNVQEIVDYYSKDFEYKDDLSWVMYKNGPDDDENVQISRKEYKEIIQNDSVIYENKYRKPNSNTNNGIYPDAQSDLKTSGKPTVYIGGLANKGLASGEDAYVYLTFRVKKTNEKNQGIIKDKVEHNWVEINGYTTHYENNTNLPNYGTKGSTDVAGLIDYNSTPGNLNKDIVDNHKLWLYEDDADRSKGIKLTIQTDFVRGLNGIVWEDQRKKPIENAWVGDGIRNNGEIGVNGVRVQLVEKLDNGNECIWGEVKSGKEDGNNLQIIENKNNVEAKPQKQNIIPGKYNFTNFIPGNYIVRFIYGDNDETVKRSEKGGSNITSYNGQDFKSTTYQGSTGGDGIAIYEPNDDEKTYIHPSEMFKENLYNGRNGKKYQEYYYNIDAADKAGKNYSDARDIYNDEEEIKDTKTGNKNQYQGRSSVIGYSKDSVQNDKAEILASPYYKGDNEIEDRTDIDDLMKYTHMTAETALIVMEGEYNRTETDGYEKDKDNNIVKNPDKNGNNFNGKNNSNGNYIFNNIDFGLEERPKAQLELNKKVSNVKISLANGTVLFNAKDKVDNLVWKKGKEYDLDKSAGYKEKKYDDYYSNDHRYAYRSEINREIIGKIFGEEKDNGLIQATMDSEAMHGATIQIIYELTVTNVGEVDYDNLDFYYTGVGNAKQVQTSADVVLDYVANNLKFRPEDNNGTDTNGKDIKWDVITHNGSEIKDYVDGNVESQLNKFETVVKTEQLKKPLKPGGEVNTFLTLTQLITPQNKSDQLTYDNIAEIVQISNDVGRRMAYSIQGNQDPTDNPKEVDSFKAEPVKILPPYGAKYTYYILGVGIAIILVGGIVLIQKKVLRKKE